jgi:hypothetical protein
MLTIDCIIQVGPAFESAAEPTHDILHFLFGHLRPADRSRASRSTSLSPDDSSTCFLQGSFGQQGKLFLAAFAVPHSDRGSSTCAMSEQHCLSIMLLTHPRRAGQVHHHTSEKVLPLAIDRIMSPARKRSL